MVVAGANSVQNRVGSKFPEFQACLFSSVVGFEQILAYLGKHMYTVICARKSVVSFDEA